MFLFPFWPFKKVQSFSLTAHFSKPMFILPLCFWSLSGQLHRERGEGRSGAGHKWNVTESSWESLSRWQLYLVPFCLHLASSAVDWRGGHSPEVKATYVDAEPEKCNLKPLKLWDFFFSQDGRGHAGQHNPRASECKCFLYYNGVMFQTS